MMVKEQLFFPRLVCEDRRLPPFTPRNTPAQQETALGAMHLKEGDVGFSVASFRKALLNDPRLPDAHFGLGIATLKFSKGHPPAREDMEKRAMASFSMAIELAGAQNASGPRPSLSTIIAYSHLMLALHSGGFDDFEGHVLAGMEACKGMGGFVGRAVMHSFGALGKEMHARVAEQANNGEFAAMLSDARAHVDFLAIGMENAFAEGN
jgi:hypothetical protein